jgi:hypothetical protein
MAPLAYARELAVWKDDSCAWLIVVSARSRHIARLEVYRTRPP